MRAGESEEGDLIQLRLSHFVAKSPYPSPTSGRREWRIIKLEAHLAEGGPWLLGETYSLADIKWYSMVPGLPRMTPEICNPETTPHVAAWLARMAERPAVTALEAYRG